MQLTDIYKLPSPELSSPAQGSEGFKNLATAVENQAYPALDNYSWAVPGVAYNYGFYIPVSHGSRTTLFDVNIPSDGVVGWVDADADAIITCEPGASFGGEFEIWMNGSLTRMIRWHNWWRTDCLSLYNSVRVPNLNGLPMKMAVTLYVDANSSPGVLSTGNASYQVYGRRVV